MIDCIMDNKKIIKLCNRLAWQQFKNPKDGDKLHISIVGKATFTNNLGKRTEVDVKNLPLSSLDDEDLEYYTFFYGLICGNIEEISG